MLVEVVLFVVAAVLLHYWATRPKGMPPGPMVIPFLGSRVIMTVDQVRAANKKYGPIFKSEIGSNRMIFLCDYKLIKESLSKLEFADRPAFHIQHFLTNGVESGVIFTNGQRWQNARRFLLRNLRDLGMGKSYLEGSILEEAKHLVRDFEGCVDQPTPIPNSVNVAALNIIWQMVAGTRYNHDEEAILKIMKLLKDVDSSSPFVLLEFFPALRKLVPSFLEKYMVTDHLNKVRDAVTSFFQVLIDEHRATLDADNPRDVIDEYLIAMDTKSAIAEYFHDIDLMRIIFDLFGAGFDTTSNMLRWVILYMANHADDQRRIQAQIDSVLGRDELPSHLHRAQLSYVDAMVQEVLRLGSLIHNGVQHAAHQDTTLAGYLIPKGSWVFPAAGICHMNPEYWDQPEEFRLQRFLDQDDKFVLPKEGLLPFGSGKRVCLGESLARMELFTFSAVLLQRFTFAPPEGSHIDLGPDSKMPMGRFPKEQNVVITLRQ